MNGPTATPTEPSKRGSCLRLVLWVLLAVLLVLLLVSVTAVVLGELGVWEEFWDLVERHTGFQRD